MSAPGGAAERPLRELVRGGLAWSTVNNVVLRLGGLAIGIVLARLLTPEQFGVYAIALTVQAVLMAVADFGLSADLIRSRDFERRAPTVATLGAVTGLGLAIAMALAARPVAVALGAADAAGAIVVLSATLFLAGAGVVPYAALQRRFDQRSLFMIGMVDLLISSALTIVLVLLGWGVVSLAIGRLAAQAVTLVLQFVLAHERPRYAVDRTLVGPVLAFGLPVAGANLLSWAVLGADKVVLGRTVGATLLGYYVLAFNVSAWPMTLIGQAVRAVALPLFSRTAQGTKDQTAARVITPIWAVSVLGAAMLGAVSTPLVTFVYGSKWAAAGVLLVPLVAFGAMRVLFDLIASYLYARGESRGVLVVQAVWMVVLLGALVVGARTGGALGAAWAHLLVAALVVTPLYLIIARRAGADSGAIVASLWPPVVAGILAALVGHVVAGEVDSEPVAVLVGVLAVLASYALLLGWWVVPRARGLWRSRAAPLPAPGAADSPSPHRPDDPSPRPETPGALTVNTPDPK